MGVGDTRATSPPASNNPFLTFMEQVAQRTLSRPTSPSTTVEIAMEPLPPPPQPSHTHRSSISSDAFRSAPPAVVQYARLTSNPFSENPPNGRTSQTIYENVPIDVARLAPPAPRRMRSNEPSTIAISSDQIQEFGSTETTPHWTPTHPGHTQSACLPPTWSRPTSAASGSLAGGIGVDVLGASPAVNLSRAGVGGSFNREGMGRAHLSTAENERVQLTKFTKVGSPTRQVGQEGSHVNDVSTEDA